jgi:hypothetical protein
MAIYSILLSTILLALSWAEQLPLREKGNNPFDPKFGELAKKTLDYWRVPGIAIGVVDGGDVWTEVSCHFVEPLMLLPFSWAKSLFQRSSS